MKKKLEYYTAEWCGPCRMFKPTIIGLINEGYNIEIKLFLMDILELLIKLKP